MHAYTHTNTHTQKHTASFEGSLVHLHVEVGDPKQLQGLLQATGAKAPGALPCPPRDRTLFCLCKLSVFFCWPLKRPHQHQHYTRGWGSSFRHHLPQGRETSGSRPGPSFQGQCLLLLWWCWVLFCSALPASHVRIPKIQQLTIPHLFHY